jgi:hypothetical protein
MPYPHMRMKFDKYEVELEGPIEFVDKCRDWFKASVIELLEANRGHQTEAAGSSQPPAG